MGQAKRLAELRRRERANQLQVERRTLRIPCPRHGATQNRSITCGIYGRRTNHLNGGRHRGSSNDHGLWCVNGLRRVVSALHNGLRGRSGDGRHRLQHRSINGCRLDVTHRGNYGRGCNHRRCWPNVSSGLHVSSCLWGVVNALRVDLSAGRHGCEPECQSGQEQERRCSHS